MALPVSRWADVRRTASLVRLTPFDASSAEGRSRERYRRIALTTLSAFLARGVGMLASLVTVPLTLAYLGKPEYGLWATITSFTTWVVLFDFGIVNGLVNVVAEADGRDDRAAAASYVSTAFFLLLGIALALGALFALLLPLVPWARVFSTRGLVSGDVVRWSVAAAVLPVLVSLPIAVVRQIYAGYQRGYVSNAFLAAGALATLGALVAAVRAQVGLPTLILVSAGTSVAVSALGLAYLFGVQMPWLRPRLAVVSRPALRRLLATSVPLFLFQLGALLVNNTQLLILAHRTELTTVADYSILTRLYVVLASFVTLSTNAFVPSFREAHERGDAAWLRRSFQRMLALRMALSGAAALVLLVAGNQVLALWLGGAAVRFGAAEWLMLGVLMLSATWVTAYADLLTIMDRIWIQVGVVVLNGVATAALTYWLAPDGGVLGALAAMSCVSVLISTWLMPLVGRRVIRPA